MHPLLFQVGPFAIYTYGFLAAVAFLTLAAWAIRRAPAIGVEPDHMVDVIFWTAIAAIAGSRALYVWQNPRLFDSPVDWVNLRTGGLVFYGALLAGLPAAWMVVKYRRLPAGKVLDVFGIGLPFAHGVTRLGCLAAGCCYGSPSDLPWSVVYPESMFPGEGMAPSGVHLHPTPVYEALALFALSGSLAWLNQRPHPPGRTMLLYVAGYAIIRTVTEAFRGDAGRGWFLEGVLGTALSTSQGVSLVLFALAVVGVVLQSRRAAA